MTKFGFPFNSQIELVGRERYADQLELYDTGRQQHS